MTYFILLYHHYCTVYGRIIGGCDLSFNHWLIFLISRSNKYYTMWSNDYDIVWYYYKLWPTVIIKIYNASWFSLPRSLFEFISICFIRCPPLCLHLRIMIRSHSHYISFFADFIFFFITAMRPHRVAAWCHRQLPFHNQQLFLFYFQSQLSFSIILGGA